MDVDLPSKNVEPTPTTIRAMRDGLTAVIAYHPQAANKPCYFYEVLDRLLGPWGKQGYPIHYGAFYCAEFNADPNLQSSRVLAEWVRKTTIKLQEALRDFVVAEFAAGRLPALTEAKFREFAFRSHAAAYLEGGLAKVVVLESPLALALIVSVAAREFNPATEDFVPTLQQAMQVAGALVGEVPMLLAPALAPETQMFRVAIERDRRRFLADLQMSRYLAGIERAVQSGKLDNIAWLNEIANRINGMEYPDSTAARRAAEVVGLVHTRKAQVAAHIRRQIRDHAELKSVYDRLQPGWTWW